MQIIGKRLYSRIISRNELEKVIIFFLISLITSTIWAQKGFGLRAGIGSYDLGNAGIRYQVSKRSSFEITGGTNFGLNNKTQWSTGLYYNQVFLKSVVWKIRPGYSIGALYWTLEDDFYYFKTITAPVSALLVYPLTSFLIIRIENGIAFNKVAESTRKQNIKAGFPDRFNYVCGLTFIYKINRHENK